MDANFPTLDEAVCRIHAKFVEEAEAAETGHRARIAAGQMLLELRARIETGGEAGEGVNWWGWYKSKFTRSRRDAEKIMAVARAADPDAADREARAKDAKRKRDTREYAADVRRSQNEAAKQIEEAQVRNVERLADFSAGAAIAIAPAPVAKVDTASAPIAPAEPTDEDTVLPETMIENALNMVLPTKRAALLMHTVDRLKPKERAEFLERLGVDPSDVPALNCERPQPDFADDGFAPDPDVEMPGVIIANFMDSVADAKSVAEAWRKITKRSPFNGVVKQEIYDQIGLLIRKWRLVQTRLTRGVGA